PFSRSGWVTSAATSWPASSSASSEGTANAPVPRKTRRSHSSQSSVRAFLRSLRLSRSRLSGVRRSTNSRPSTWSISWQNARARKRRGPLVRALRAVRVEALDHHARGADGRAAEAGHREAALVVALLALLDHELGVDELDELLGVFADGEVHHDHAERDRDLR